jgi:3-oxoacyl-[acyl-carrier protein] reductase
MRMSEEDWDTVLNTNLRGAFAFTKAFTRTFVKQRSGRIINVASVSGLIGNAGQCNYAASKAGLIGFTKSLARELASRGITVNALAPGFITTDMTAGLTEELKAGVLRQIPLGRFGEAEDIAQAALFLAGPARCSRWTAAWRCERVPAGRGGAARKIRQSGLDALRHVA